MNTRLFACIAVAGIFLGVLASSETANAQSAVKTYKAPRTVDGQPDLQGFWSNTTYTPLQRPNGVTKGSGHPQLCDIQRANARVPEWGR